MDIADLKMPGSVIGETSNVKDSIINLNNVSDGVLERSNFDIKHHNNSILNTVSKIFNQTTKVPEMQDFKIVKPICRGAFGKVFLDYKRTEPDQIYAIKVEKKNEMICRTTATQVLIQRNSLAIVTSPYCVQFFYSLQFNTSVYSVMEYMVGRDLNCLLTVYSYIEESISAFYTVQLSLALEYLYSRGIVQRDKMPLKLKNMLLSKEDYLKLADFDLGKISTPHLHVEISDLRLKQIMAWNNIAHIRCEFSYFVRYNCISRSSKKYCTMLLFKAVKSCKKSLVKQLLNSGVHINASTPCCPKHHVVKDCFHSLLMVNAIYGNSDITRMLIRAGCHLNTATICGITALHFALEFSNRDVAAELIQSGANVHLETELTGSTALQLAIVCSTHIDKTMKILRKNMLFCCFMNYVSEYLHSIFLVRIGNLSQKMHDFGRKRRVCLYLVKMLLDSGADVNHKDKYGCSAIHYAAFTDNLELMKILIQAGADIDSQNSIGVTALHNAVLFNDEAMVLLLLNSGANITIKTQQGDSVLLLISTLIKPSNDYVILLRKLLEHGGEVNEKNVNNMTIMDLLCNVKSIILHVAEVEARTQKKVFDEHNLASVNKYECIKDFYERVQDELAAMRNNKIKNTAISYLSILTEPMEEVARWVRNKEFVKNFEASDYQTAYSAYAPRLREKIVAATGHKKKSVKWHKVEFSCGI